MRLALSAGVMVVAASNFALGAAPRVAPDGIHRADVLAVTLCDARVRLRDGVLTDGGVGVLAPMQDVLARLRAGGAKWERAYPDVGEARLDEMHAAAERYWGQGIANLNSQYTLWLPEHLDAAAVGAELEGLALVRRAEPFLVGGLAYDPVPPNFTGNQGYFNASPVGIQTSEVATWPGGRGAGVRVVDCERQWNFEHQEFAGNLTRVGPVSNGDPNTTSNDHGTAVMGVLISANNGWGTTGSVPEAVGYAAHVYTGGVYNVAAAVVNATTVLGAGGVMLIEQQMPGPNAGAVIAMEWRLDVYNAIRTAVGNGIVVCEAAGNGNQNFDLPVYNTGNGGHYPFQLANDSGAIMVGASAAGVGGSTTARSRLTFSNYGATLDLQGWGERVFTIAYGDAYNTEGVNLRYTATFSGTSSATPIVSSACALLQSVHRAVAGRWLTPAEVKDHLRATGAAQTAGLNPVTQNIGPFPNVRAAIARALGNRDCNTNGRPDAVDIAMSLSMDRNGNGVPDECDPRCVADVDDGSGNGVPDGGVTIDDLLYYLTIFTAGNIRADVDNGSGTGVQDGGVTVEDLLYYLERFDRGC